MLEHVKTLGIMIITIDGPAGAGKSTAARGLARELGYRFLDTGAMYRAVALDCLQQGVDFEDEAAVLSLARSLRITFDGQKVFLNGSDVSSAIRTSDVTAASRPIAANVPVREHLTELQREAALDGDVVTEGRDQGTVVFPHADFKFYLTADPHARADRRQRDFAQRGQTLPLEQVLRDQEDRDRRDAGRDVGPLKPAEDAILVDTSNMNAEQTIDHLAKIVRGEKLVSEV